MATMKKLVWLSVFILLVSACGQAPAPVVEASQITQLATVEVTRLATVEVTRLVVVTATYSGPTETPTPTATLAPSATPMPTVDQTKADKRDGSYMVGTEISAGIWRSSGGNSSDNCWIQIKTDGSGFTMVTNTLWKLVKVHSDLIHLELRKTILFILKVSTFLLEIIFTKQLIRKLQII